MLVRDEDQPTNNIPTRTEIEAQEAAAKKQAQEAAAKTTPGTTYYGPSNAAPTTGGNLEAEIESGYFESDSSATIDNTTSTEENAITKRDYAETKREIAMQKSIERIRNNEILDSMGLPDAYGDTYKQGGDIWATSLRTGKPVDIGDDRSYLDEFGSDAPLDYVAFEESPSGVRVMDENGLSVSAISMDGDWVPGKKSTLVQPIITERTEYDPFQIDMTGTNNKGGLITYPAWVISEDIKTVVEPGNYNYEKAINDHGKAMDFLGGYDPKRGVFVISVGGKYQAGNQGELHEVMRLSNEDFDYYFGTSAHNIDEFAARAIGPVNKRTFVDVTTPATSSKAGSVMSIDVNNTRDLGEFMAGFKSLLPHPDIGEGSLRESDGSAIIKNKNSNFIDDAWGVVDSIWPKHAPIREFLTPDEFKPLLSKKSMLDPYYQTVEGKKELRDFSFIVSMGLIGSAPAGLGKGVSFIDDIVRKTPVVKEAYTGLEEFVTPITRSTAAGLNKVGMSREVKPIYDMSVRGAGVARDLEPGVMPVLDLSKTTRINPGATNIVEKELLKGEHTVYGGGAAGAQYKFTTPRVSRDIDAFVTNPELVESRINMRLDKAGLEKEVTDLHAFPEGYPIGRSRVEVEVYDEAPDTGLKLGSRLLGDPIPKVPRSKDILIGGKGELNYEKLNYLAVRKYNAIYEDIAGIESKKSSPALVSRLSNRLGKDALDARLHMTELNMASSSRGESVPGLGKVMGDFDRLYARPIKINIGGVERQTTVGQLAMEESMKFNKAAMPMGKINLNMERSIVTPSIMSSPRSRVASLSFGPSMMKSLSASASSKSMSTSMSIKSPSLPSTSPSVSFKMPSYKPPKLNSRAVSTMSGFSTKSVNPFKSPSSVFKPSTRTRGYGSTSPRPSPRPSTIFKEYSPLSENKKKEGKKDLLGLGENTRWQYSGVFDMGDMFQAPKTHRVKRRRKK